MVRQQITRFKTVRDGAAARGAKICFYSAGDKVKRIGDGLDVPGDGDMVSVYGDCWMKPFVIGTEYSF